MTTTDETHELVPVYESTAAADCEAVRELLEANGIRAMLEDSKGPFVGLTVAPSTVLVWKKDADLSRTLIDKAHHARR